jgi:general secretion pathway protein A
MGPLDNSDAHLDIDWHPVDHYPAAMREMMARRTTAPASYEAYYGLAEPPFSLSPNVRFAFRSGSYAIAFDQVCRALERREGFIVITGEVGTGKSMLCRAAMQTSGANTFVSLILDPCVTAEELLAQVLSDFGVLDRDTRSPRRVVPAPLHQLIVVLQRFLMSLVPLGGRAVVIIDEAQHLHPVLLEQLRLWSNLDGDGPPLLQVILSGQPELDVLLGRPEMRQVRQRVSRRCELTGLQRSEVAEYIDHRLAVARGPDDREEPVARPLAKGDFWSVRFTPSAARAVAALSQGVPRLVNLLADRALEVGCERQARTIDAKIVREGARRLNLQPAGIPRVQLQIAAAAAVVLLLAGGVGWKAIAQRSQQPPRSAWRLCLRRRRRQKSARSTSATASPSRSLHCARSSGRLPLQPSSSKLASRRSRAGIPTACPIRSSSARTFLRKKRLRRNVRSRRRVSPVPTFDWITRSPAAP